mgnify:CR=1 FL=1
MTCIVYKLIGTADGSARASKRETKLCVSRAEMDRYMQAMSRKYAGEYGVLIEVYDDRDNLISSSIV